MMETYIHIFCSRISDPVPYQLYSSCVALFYRKRLPQQNVDRRIGERETCMHLIVCRAKVGARALPSPHTR
jgi:hypothetical protein